MQTFITKYRAKNTIFMIVFLIYFLGCMALIFYFDNKKEIYATISAIASCFLLVFFSYIGARISKSKDIEFYFADNNFFRITLDNRQFSYLKSNVKYNFNIWVNNEGVIIGTVLKLDIADFEMNIAGRQAEPQKFLRKNDAGNKTTNVNVIFEAAEFEQFSSNVLAFSKSVNMNIFSNNTIEKKQTEFKYYLSNPEAIFSNFTVKKGTLTFFHIIMALNPIGIAVIFLIMFIKLMIHFLKFLKSQIFHKKIE